ncbi:MAG: indolepyruvate oxidoreductase subunit beta [Desulfonauticus sp.]|nr:indolepyruvate oxidoreductase subunit beta [Desulfonauticus sp.]
MSLKRIFFAGVGGQGTLTVTNLFARLALDKGIPVTAGEIHGMAQRGGVVHTFVLLGGYLSPKIEQGEADVLLGFEPLETVRALPFLKYKQGVVVSSKNPIYPVNVSLGQESYLAMSDIKDKCQRCANKSYFFPVLEKALQLGIPQVANIMLLAAFLALDVVEISLKDLKEGVKKYLSPKIVDINLKAIDQAKALINF